MGQVYRRRFVRPRRPPAIALRTKAAAPGGGGDPPVFRSVATAVDPGPFGTTNTVLVTKPTGVVSGDLLLFAIAWDFDFAGSDSITWPSGFTEIFHQKNDGPANGEHMRLACAWKLAGGSEPTDYTTTLPGNNGGFEAAILAYSGCHQTTPINISGSNLDDNAGSPENVTATGVTTTVANCTVVALFGSYASNPGATNCWEPPASMTERVDLGMTTGITCLEITDVAQASAGATGNKVAVADQAIANCAGIVALRPAAAADIAALSAMFSSAF